MHTALVRRSATALRRRLALERTRLRARAPQVSGELQIEGAITRRGAYALRRLEPRTIERAQGNGGKRLQFHVHALLDPRCRPHAGARRRPCGGLDSQRSCPTRIRRKTAWDSAYHRGSFAAANRAPGCTPLEREDGNADTRDSGVANAVTADRGRRAHGGSGHRAGEARKWTPRRKRRFGARSQRKRAAADAAIEVSRKKPSSGLATGRKHKNGTKGERRRFASRRRERVKGKDKWASERLETRAVRRPSMP